MIMMLIIVKMIIVTTAIMMRMRIGMTMARMMMMFMMMMMRMRRMTGSSLRLMVWLVCATPRRERISSTQSSVHTRWDISTDTTHHTHNY